METADRPAQHEGQTNSAYLFMLASALSFAMMGAFSHLAGERCDWQIVALARASLAFVFSAGLALSPGARLALLRPPVLWLRSAAGGLGLPLAFCACTPLRLP